MGVEQFRSLIKWNHYHEYQEIHNNALKVADFIIGFDFK